MIRKKIRQKSVNFSFELTIIEGIAYSTLSVSSGDSDLPLTEAERKYLFKKLGLL